jgi:hypothetical protein
VREVRRRTRGIACPAFFKEKIMLALFLIGAGLGVGLTLGFIFTNYVLISRKEREEEEITKNALFSRLDKLVAENAKLRVALATGVMAEDAKKIASTIMATLDVLIDTKKVVMQKCDALDHPEVIEERIRQAIGGEEELVRGSSDPVE